MGNRFEKLFALPANMYSIGSPVIVSAGALLKDTETGKLVVQIKFHSISKTPIIALKLCIRTFDIGGEETAGVQKYQYLDLNVANGQDFGSNKAIVLPNTVARSFEIASLIVILSDGTVNDVCVPMYALPKSSLLLSALKNSELLKQYQHETTTASRYLPQVNGDLWCCTCGVWNIDDSCTNCNLDKSIVFQPFDISVLESNMNERLAAEKLECEKQMRLADKRKKVEEEKNKKHNRRVAAIVALLFTVICAISGILYYNSQHKYDEIAGIYALQNLEEAEEAIYEFHEDSIEEYGFNPYSFELKIEGSGKVYGLWFVNDRGSLTPRAATVKSVSEDGVVELDVLDYPQAKVTLTINTETGEATYLSRSKYDSLELSYHRITEELANNGYKECSVDQIRADLSFVQGLFELNSINAITDKYPEATATDAKDDLRIDGSFCGANGTFQIWELDGIYGPAENFV